MDQGQHHPAASSAPAVMLFVFAQRGDNSKAMRVVAGVIIALAVLGVATTGRADEVGTWLASLVTG